jgi:hypothetical protein
LFKIRGLGLLRSGVSCRVAVLQPQPQPQVAELLVVYFPSLSTPGAYVNVNSHRQLKN